MDLVKICENVVGNQLARIKLAAKPIRIRFRDRKDLSFVIDSLVHELTSVIFNINSFYVSKMSTETNPKLCKYLESLGGNEAECFVYFGLDLQTNDHTPTFEIHHGSSKVQTHDIRIDTLACIDYRNNGSYIHESLCRALRDYFCYYRRALLYLWDVMEKLPSMLHPHHFLVHSEYLTVLYPSKINEELEYRLRQSIHTHLKLPCDSPVFRRGQALHSVPKLCKWLGPNNELLVCPHETLKMPSDNNVYLVKGRYTYKHYLQDAIDDKNWGCAYRSLQTLISWLMWQGEIQPQKIPSISDIQASLVRVGDKPKTFIGSRQWIGSLEVSFCLQEMYSIQCRLLPVPKGSQMGQIAGPTLAQHFANGGGPVMVGGGQLAHTIIGIYLPQTESDTSENVPSPKYLILDPHYTGPSGCLKTVTSKGWCGWKASNFWKPDVHYNLCLVPPIQPGRV